MFVVMTKTFYDSDIKAQYMDLCKRSMDLFKAQPGLIGIRMHVSHDDTHTATYFKWESKENHEACMSNPDWGEFNQEFGSLMEAGKIRFELNTYEVLDF
ncbi:MAG: antibiotic biosynthesis monooxygenase [Proteobacteria bacterium]|nr:antibiotic biosynthesis monooxygenase [Pseudomonadota bacterium]